MKKLLISLLMLVSVQNAFGSSGNYTNHKRSRSMILEINDAHDETTQNRAHDSANNSANNSADDYMNRYSSPEQRNYLIAAPFVAQYNQAFKALYLADVEARYDIGWMGCLKSYFVDTPESKILKGISQTKNQIKEQLNILQNNTWKQWGWSAAKYAAIILGTVAVVKYTNILKTAQSAEVIADAVTQ